VVAAPGTGTRRVPPPLPLTASEFIEKELVSFLGIGDFSRFAPEGDAHAQTPEETVAHDDIEALDDTEDS
jgi:hypothetical protein